VRVAELENNNYGTDNYLDRSFGVLQYDAKWTSDTDKENNAGPGYVTMIPKFLKCQKEYYPTPLATLQKMTIDIHRPNGQLLTTTPDTWDIAGIIGAGEGPTLGSPFPFTVIPTNSLYNVYNPFSPVAQPNPANFFIVTNKYFSKFDMSVGDRINISGYTYTNAALNDPVNGEALRDFCNWINRTEGHLILSIAYTNTDTTILDGSNNVGYANVIIIQARYQDPTTGSQNIAPFGGQTNFSNTLYAYGAALQSPCRVINMNKQLNLVFRVITREMDALPQIRSDNNY
jgi:hypothetical protein